MSEQWYDDTIAPRLLEIAQLCKEHGASIVATVEFEPTKRGSTILLGEGAGLAMNLTRMCVLAGDNIDSFLIGAKRYCDKKGIDTSASIVMQQLFGARP